MRMGTLILVMVLAVLAGCGGSGAGGMGGSGGQGGDGGRTGGPIPCGVLCGDGGAGGAPEPMAVGETGVDCATSTRWYAGPGEEGYLGSQAIVLPCAGTVIGASVVHSLDTASGACGPTDRAVMVSVPGDALSSPMLHERIDVTAEDVEAGTPSPLGKSGVEVGGAVAPVHGQAGQVVHVASVLTAGTCALSCTAKVAGYELVDGEWCSAVEAWEQCAPMSDPLPAGAGKTAAWFAWVDFLPDDPAACE